MEKKFLSFPFLITKESIVEDDEYYRFEGYASTYNNIDLGDDMVVPGAFDKTLKSKSPIDIKLLYQHDSRMPLGVYDELRSDKIGLFVKAKMPKDNSQVRDVMSLMKCGAINSMSIGYAATDYEYDERGVRLLKEIDLYEISLVTMPMNPKALLTGLKAEDLDDEQEADEDKTKNKKVFKKFYIEDIKDITTKREFERCLRESGAFSKQAAVKLASNFGILSDSKTMALDKQLDELRQLINDKL